MHRATLAEASRNYVLLAAATACAALGLVSAFNGLLDPYAITQWVAIPGINLQKPGVVGRERIYRAFEIRRVHPDAIVLGTSRAAYGLPMDSTLWRGAVRRNLGMSGLTLHEARRAFELAAATGELKQAVIGLDLFAFNVARKPYPDFSERLFSPYVPQPVALFERYGSAAVIGDAVQMVKRQGEPWLPLFTADGSFSTEEMSDRWLRIGGSHAFFRWQFRGFISYEYFPGGADFSLHGAGGDTLAELRALLESARRHGVDVRLFFSPEHAWLLEAVRHAGLWHELEAWKRGVVAIAAGMNVPLWDFQTINARTAEEVPAADRPWQPMHWWWDGSHYTRAYGHDLLERVLAADAAPDALGAPATPADVDRSLAELAAALDRYERAHPDDVRELDAIAASCPRCPKR